MNLFKNQILKRGINIIIHLECVPLSKLRLGVCISSSAYTNLKYNKAHKHSIFDKRLKEIDNEYLVSYVNMRKYPILLFIMAKIMEMNNQEQNQVAMYLYNSI